ncbi:MAG: hypothetical protein C9355_08445 [Thalassolituus maritimus]|nr:MAG: hypothetical protein C9355_08445 [Thalassolituus maritimus]
MLNQVRNVLLGFIVLSISLHARTDDENFLVESFLGKLVQKHNIEINYSPSVNYIRLDNPGELPLDQAVRFLSGHFNVITAYQDKQLVQLDILPKGSSDRSDMMTLKPDQGLIPLSTRSHPTLKETPPQPLPLSPFFIGKKNRTATIDALKKVRKNDPERYHQLRFRYGPKIIREVEKAPED